MDGVSAATIVLPSWDRDEGPIESTVATPARVDSRIARVDAARILNADPTPGEWLTHGHPYGERRHGPLAQIDTSNVCELGLAWYADLPTNRGVETTPLMADGTLYVTTSWSHVIAYDAKSGEERRPFDPEVAKEYAVNACCP